MGEASQKKALEQEEGKAEDQADEDHQKPGSLPKGKDYLLDTVEKVEMRDAKKKKGNPDAFGWDVFNQDSLLRAHEKRLKHIEFDEKAYNEQKEEIEAQAAPSLFDGFGHQASDEAKNRLQEA